MKQTEALAEVLTKQFGTLIRENAVELWAFSIGGRAKGSFSFTIGAADDGSYKLSSTLSYSQKAKHSLRETYTPAEAPSAPRPWQRKAAAA